MKVDIVVTRHKGLIDLLKEMGILDDNTKIITHVSDPNIIKGKTVLGVLPLHLAALCEQVIIPVLELKPEDRGKELSKEETKERFKGLKKFRVIELE